MQICVIGHSGTTWLADLQTELQRITGEPMAVTGFRFRPYGPAALDFALGKVEEASADVVILPVNLYPCALSDIGLRIKQRFGEHAYRWYKLPERRFTVAMNPGGGLRMWLHRQARGLGRRVIGAAPFASVDEVAGTYCDILKALARREHIQVVVAAENRFSAAQQAANPGVLPTIESLLAPIRAVAAEHRFSWRDIDAEISRDGCREDYFQPDGVHMLPAGNTIIVAMFLEVLRPLLAPIPA